MCIVDGAGEVMLEQNVASGMGGRERGPVVKTVRRPAPRVDRERLAEDVLVRLRKQLPTG